MQADLNDSNLITGTVTDPGNWTADLRVNRAAVSGSQVPFAGNYTLIFPGITGNSQLPAGDGFATVPVATAGKVKWAGTLADGTKLSQSTVVAANGQWPFYVSLYAGQGQILGWLTVTTSGPENVGGDVSWIKPAIPNAKFYPGGFNFNTHATGSIYNGAASPLINFSNGVIVLAGGNLVGPITNAVTVNGTSASGSGISLSLNAPKGTFKGSAANPPSKGKISFSGVFLQNQNFGSGFFLGTSQSSRVFFGPAN